MYSGVFVLKGIGDLNGLWRFLITILPQSICIGNAKEGTCQLFNVAPDTAFSELLYMMCERFRFNAYSYAMWGDTPHHMHVPQRNSTVAAWSSVPDSDTPKTAVDLLLRLNQTAWEKNKELQGNYATKVAERVLDNLGNKPQSLSILYSGPKTSIILSTKHTKLSFWIVYSEGTYFLLWSTQDDLVQRAMGFMSASQMYQWLVVPVEFDHQSMALPIQPLFLVNKFHTNMKHHHASNAALYVIQYMMNYLRRIAVPLPVQANSNVGDHDG